jgi:hypothetical protein
LRISANRQNDRHEAVPLVLLIIAAAFGSASPNLGDSYDKVEDSYRNLPERHLRDDGCVSILYRKGRYLNFVILANGRSVSERYSRVKRTDLSEMRLQDS